MCDGARRLCEHNFNYVSEVARVRALPSRFLYVIYMYIFFVRHISQQFRASARMCLRLGGRMSRRTRGKRRDRQMRAWQEGNDGLYIWNRVVCGFCVCRTIEESRLGLILYVVHKRRHLRI